jgi:hypothetical protein
MTLRLGFVAGFFCITTIYLCIGLKNHFNPGLLCFSVQIMIDTITFFSYTMVLYNDMKVLVISSERMIRYTELETEG